MPGDENRSDEAPLVVVSEAFTANGKGVLVMPRVVVNVPVRGPFNVRLELPNGTQRTATASMDVAHIQGKGGTYAMYRILEVTPEDLPEGTKIYAE